MGSTGSTVMQNIGKRIHKIRNPAKFIIPYTEERIPYSLYRTGGTIVKIAYC
jgi:hypothetical protein